MWQHVPVRRRFHIQLPVDLLEKLDHRARRLRTSRSALIREALERSLAEPTDDEIDRQIVEGYTRHPPEEAWGDAPVRALIQAEPW